jgi:hypothetical protein
VKNIPTYLNAVSMFRFRFTLLIFLLVFFLDPETDVVEQECK